MKIEHTPTPWKLDATPNASGRGSYLIFAPDPHMGAGVSTVVAKVAWERVECEANASFIVTAVNSHDALVTALKALRDAIMDGLCNGGTPAYDKDAPERLDKAITTADALLHALVPAIGKEG